MLPQAAVLPAGTAAVLVVMDVMQVQPEEVVAVAPHMLRQVQSVRLRVPITCLTIQLILFLLLVVEVVVPITLVWRELAAIFSIMGQDLMEAYLINMRMEVKQYMMALKGL